MVGDDPTAAATGIYLVPMVDVEVASIVEFMVMICGVREPPPFGGVMVLVMGQEVVIV